MGLQNLKTQWVSPMGFETMAMECPHGGNSYPQFHLNMNSEMQRYDYINVILSF